MGDIAFSNYGYASTIEDIDYTVLAGRYMSDKNMEKNILEDIYYKLKFKDSDNVLEIGSGAGNLSIPISFIVNTITCCDHKLVLDKMKKRFSGSDNIQYISGNFLDVSLEREYSKILIYNVLQVLQNRDDVFRFLNKALSSLTSGGRLLLGDIANVDNENIFYKSNEGKKWIENHIGDNDIYRSKGLKAGVSDYLKDKEKDTMYVKVDNELIFDILKEFREKGYKTYLLEQKCTLPYSTTREDILIVKI